eukprot:sb/3473345/
MLDGTFCSPLCPLKPELVGKVVVPTDILDLASALPADITAKVIAENAAFVPWIRKRNVRGMSEVLYERFELEDAKFRMIGEITPPQCAVNGATPAHLITGLTATWNVNSCQLYMNMSNFYSKMDFLDSIRNRPFYDNIKRGIFQVRWLSWNF